MQLDSALPIAGIRLAGVMAGVKKANRRDLVVIEIAEGAAVAGVFTLNRFCAAPVTVAKERLLAATPRYLMINTGYANAGTGDEGMRRCRAATAMLAAAAGCDEAAVLPFSTGVIGELFPLAPFESGLPAALAALSADGWYDAAEGIMTTDSQRKLASESVTVAGSPVSVTGIAKGAGMIKPNMATMLGFICTDAAIDPALLKRWSRQLADASFNRVTVDGDTSTNDACMLVATGKADMAMISSDSDAGAAELFAALARVHVALAQMLVRDGEGATKFVEVAVSGAASDADARTVAETIAHSPLVKTALFASDPNWGRILAAVGRAPVASLDVSRVDIWLDDVQIVKGGGVAPDYAEARGAAVMAQGDISIRVALGEGPGTSILWTCDFSYDYVRINAEYRT